MDVVVAFNDAMVMVVVPFFLVLPRFFPAPPLADRCCFSCDDDDDDDACCGCGCLRRFPGCVVVVDPTTAFFLLVPGVGAQGGDLAAICQHGMTKDCGLLVNAARSIIYASSGDDFAEKAREEALKLQLEMAQLLDKV